jgi:hypothetical protein
VCCGLRCAVGASWRDGRGRDGLVQRGTSEGSGRFSSMPSMSHGLGSGQRGLGLDRERVPGYGYRARRTGMGSSTVGSTFPFSAHRVLDVMSARNKNSNFRNFQIGLVIILDKDSKPIFVMKKYDVLQKSYFNFEVWSLFQIQTLADV